MWTSPCTARWVAFEAAQKGGKIRWSTKSEQPLRDGDGPVTGAIVSLEDGSCAQINAKSVVIAAGDYPTYVPGIGHGRCVTFGRIAASTPSAATPARRSPTWTSSGGWASPQERGGIGKIASKGAVPGVRPGSAPFGLGCRLHVL